MTKAEKIKFEAALVDGFWLAKDHGRWYVGHGSGCETRLLSSVGHTNKNEARLHLIGLHVQTVNS